jgi:hypothetical protein
MNGRRHARGRHARPGGAPETAEPPDPTDAEAAAWLSDVTGGAADTGVVGSGALSSPFGMAGSRRTRTAPQTAAFADTGLLDRPAGDTGPLHGVPHPATETTDPGPGEAGRAAAAGGAPAAGSDTSAFAALRLPETAGPGLGEVAWAGAETSAFAALGSLSETAGPGAGEVAWAGAETSAFAVPRVFGGVVGDGVESGLVSSSGGVEVASAYRDVVAGSETVSPDAPDLGLSEPSPRAPVASHRADVASFFSRGVFRRAGIRRKGGGVRDRLGPRVALVWSAGVRWVVPFVASRRGQVVVGGVAGVGLVLTVAIVVVGGGEADPRAVVVGVPAGRVLPSTVSRSRVGRGVGDQAAVAYYQAKDPSDARHVRNVLWTGPMLRVYTDLPASDANSRLAIALCQTAAAYLAGGGREPMVFVHADRESGYPVLANKMSAGDDCRLNTVP